MPKRETESELDHELDDSLIGLHPDDMAEDDDDLSITDPDALLDDADEDEGEEADDDDDGEEASGEDDDEGEEGEDDDDDSHLNSRLAALEAREREQLQRDRERVKQEAEGKLEQTKSERVSKKKELEASVEDLTAKLEKAHEDGETKTAVRLQQELIDARVDLRELSRAPEPKLEDFLPEGYDADPTSKQQDQVPEPVRKRLGAWLNENRWFHKDKDAQSYAIAVGDRLAKDGYDPATKAYYTELTKAVKKRFPEHFSKQTQRKTHGDAPGSVAGRGRAGGKNRGNKRVVRIGKPDRNVLETFGLDPQDKDVLRQYGRVQRGGL